MGVTACFAERRDSLGEAMNPTNMFSLYHQDQSHRPSHRDATFSKKNRMSTSALRRAGRMMRKLGGIRANRWLGLGRTLGLRRWLIQKDRLKLVTKPGKTKKGAKLESFVRRRSTSPRRNRDESSAASVLSDASTVSDEMLSDAWPNALQEFSSKHDPTSQTIWDVVSSRAQVSTLIEEGSCSANLPLSDPKPKRPAGTCIAIDCEMVGVGQSKNRSMLARVAVVDEEGKTLLDEYVRPTERITDFRTRYSGIRPRDLVGAPAFQDVRERVASLVRGKILVGHAIHNDLRVLELPHPPMLTRDTSTYLPLRHELASKWEKYTMNNIPSLKNLSLHVLGKRIQEGEHCPVQDAAHTMELYQRHRSHWEAELLT